MRHAARAIIIEDGKMLAMRRVKQSAEYYTLVGGQLNDDETPLQAVVREIHEETGLTITAAQLVFTETHAKPYNDQSIFYCEVAPHGEVKIQDYSEEAMMNRISINIHEPLWVPLQRFKLLPFNTMQLQKAIVTALEKGFPVEPIKLS